MTEHPYRSELVLTSSSELAMWDVSIQPDVSTATGPCPRCSHHCLVEVHERVIQGGAPSSVSAGVTVESIPRRFSCNCESEHEGRPDTVLAGCGAAWAVSIERTGSTWTLRPNDDASISSALLALEREQTSQDQRVRSAAEKWLGAVTALLGLFGIAGVVSGKDAAAGLSGLGAALLAIVVIGAVIGAASAVLLGYTAAYGWPSTHQVRTSDEVKAWHEDFRKASELGAHRLRSSVVIAVGTVGLLVLAMLLIWFLPRESTAAPQALGSAGIATDRSGG